MYKYVVKLLHISSFFCHPHGGYLKITEKSEKCRFSTSVYIIVFNYSAFVGIYIYIYIDLS